MGHKQLNRYLCKQHADVCNKAATLCCDVVSVEEQAKRNSVRHNSCHAVVLEQAAESTRGVAQPRCRKSLFNLFVALDRAKSNNLIHLPKGDVAGVVAVSYEGHVVLPLHHAFCPSEACAHWIRSWGLSKQVWLLFFPFCASASVWIARQGCWDIGCLESDIQGDRN
ncbi:hypothetical protein CEXT_490251 [Caerostris extrusa]|uniref:Uncharacterized protein n=1 Tax=Caerostris extrusa TaxID=172846 RepID=A0AAV4V596_CAEEX|nr:hypothetical protein CEXT_490251 [Caerostris extrusa]